MTITLGWSLVTKTTNPSTSSPGRTPARRIGTLYHSERWQSLPCTSRSAVYQAILFTRSGPTTKQSIFMHHEQTNDLASTVSTRQWTFSTKQWHFSHQDNFFQIELKRFCGNKLCLCFRRGPWFFISNLHIGTTQCVRTVVCSSFYRNSFQAVKSSTGPSNALRNALWKTQSTENQVSAYNYCF